MKVRLELASCYAALALTLHLPLQYFSHHESYYFALIHTHHYVIIKYCLSKASCSWYISKISRKWVQLFLNYGYLGLFNFHLKFHRRPFKSIKMEFSFCNLKSMYKNSDNYVFYWMGFYSSLYIPLWDMLSIPSYLYSKILLKITIIQVAVTELGPPSFWSQCSWCWIYPYTAFPVSWREPRVGSAKYLSTPASVDCMAYVDSHTSQTWAYLEAKSVNTISYLFPPFSILTVREQKKILVFGMFVKLNMSDFCMMGLHACSWNVSVSNHFQDGKPI